VKPAIGGASTAEVRSVRRSEEAIARAKAHLLQNYRWQPVVVDRALGAQLWDVDGKRYLDMLGGIAVCSLGHCHPEVVAALKDQADRLWHVSNVFYNEPHIALGEALAQASGLERVFFSNSGGESNEALIKLARKAQRDRGHPERFEIISFDNSFHGRTLATVAATGQTKYQKGFEPMPAGFTHVSYGDLEAVRRASGPQTAAVLVECIQGEGGVRVAPPGFIRALRALCDERGWLLLIDEVQTGMGRTGTLFAFQHEGVKPDAFSLAKALGNGFPIGAMVCTEKAGASLSAGTHGSTFGGNALATAVGGAVLRLINTPAMLASIREKGALLKSGIEAIRAKHPGAVVEVRGRGLLIGVEVPGDAAAVAAKCREQGMLVNLAGEKTVRLAPPFVITAEELGESLDILGRALAA
jgi:acetylornithine/N-succinyldiaminopimelate aminotransferase